MPLLDNFRSFMSMIDTHFNSAITVNQAKPPLPHPDIFDRRKQRDYLKRLQHQEYVAQLHTKKAANPNDRPPFPPEMLNCIQNLEQIAIFSGKVSHVQKAIEQERQTNRHLDALMREPETRPQVEVIRDEVITPPLEWGLLPQELGERIHPWFRDYVAFSKKWSPRAPDIQHKGMALWIQSAVAMRRIAVQYGKLQYTPLYIVLVAPSTVWAKTTTAQIGIEFLHKAGLGWIFGADETTPEKLLSTMSGRRVPKNWEDLTPEQQFLKEKRLSMAGQVAWYYSEFGKMLREWGDDKGRNATFKTILQRMDDGEPSFTYDTHTRNEEIIENPYLALLATMTPDCMKSYSSEASSLWGDGTYGRFAFCCPVVGKKKTRDDLALERFPDEERIFPPSLLTPFRQWHNRLGERACHVVADRNKKTGEIIGHRIELAETFPQTILTLGPGVKHALDEYGDAVSLLAQDCEFRQFESCYARLRDKVLRIATLQASFEGSATVDFPHLAFAQHLAEDFRDSLHNLNAFLYRDPLLKQHAFEDSMLKYITEQKTYVSVRMLVRGEFRKHKAEEIERILNSLVDSGEIIKHPPMKGGGKYYTTPDGEKKPLPSPSKQNQAEKA
jgi:hypothetical protein